MSTIKPWIIAFRLRTLPLAFSTILTGTALAKADGQLHLAIAVLTLFTALLLQILSNLANDYGDALSGVDSDQRKGPERMVQSGHITKRAMRNALIVFALLTLLSGTSLLYIAFTDYWVYMLVFLLLGLGAIAAAINYTVGKNPYGYAGFGDLFVFLFFGIVGVAGTYILQAKTFHWTVLLPAATIGLFAVGVLNVNNIRDIESDREAGKHSIPVRIGRKKAGIYHTFLLTAGLLASLLFVLLTDASWQAYLFLLVTPLLVINMRAIMTKPDNQLDPFLKQMALTTLIFSVLFSLGQFIS